MADTIADPSADPADRQSPRRVPGPTVARKLSHPAMILTRFAPCLLLAALPALADEGISPDRPDFTNGPEVIAAGRLQLETSGAWQRDGATRQRATPTLLRLGLGHALELRLESEGLLRQRAPLARGRGDMSVGLKWKQSDASDDGPALGWLLQLATPTGSGDFKGRGMRPAAALLAAWELPRGYSLGTMAGLVSDRDESGRRYTGAMLSASLGLPLGGFVEAAAQRLAPARHGGNVVTLGTGLTWQLGSNARLDAAIFRGLSRPAPDWAGTVGVSLRF